MLVAARLHHGHYTVMLTVLSCVPQVLSFPGVDHTRTTSNHLIEVIGDLGIEAARAALMKEVRGVIEFDGTQPWPPALVVGSELPEALLRWHPGAQSASSGILWLIICLPVCNLCV